MLTPQSSVMKRAGTRSNRQPHLEPCHTESSDPHIPVSPWEVCTQASCETARTWESFDHRGLEYPPYRRTTVQV